MPQGLLQAGDDVFGQEHGKFLKIFEPYLAQYFKDKSLAEYPPIIRRFWRDLFDFTSQGKRLRAFLVYLGYLNAQSVQSASNTPGVNLDVALRTPGVSKDLRRLLSVCLAFEVIHSFLLIHDDIIDRSEKRRGKPTIHKRYEKLASPHYGISQAIIIGDIACFEAIKLITSANINDQLKILCLDKLIGVILETAYGEALDVENAQAKKREKVTARDIWQVTDLKTARYSFVGPLTIGAVLAGADDKLIKTLTRFGLLVGKAFQLQDDILGVFGDEKIMGKSTLSDLREGKNTLLIFKTMELASKGDKRQILNIWGSADAGKNDLVKVKQIIKKSGAFVWCEKEKAELARLANQEIENMNDQDKIKSLYRGLVDFVTTRGS